jgi:hypothetical protein
MHADEASRLSGTWKASIRSHLVMRLFGWLIDIFRQHCPDQVMAVEGRLDTVRYCEGDIWAVSSCPRQSSSSLTSGSAHR